MNRCRKTSQITRPTERRAQRQPISRAYKFTAGWARHHRNRPLVPPNSPSQSGHKAGKTCSPASPSLRAGSGVLHRDVKPSNVLVVRGDGGALRAKVLDFGLAQAEADVAAGTVSGTVAYLAPELIQGGAATVASDLYAVGVVAYLLLAGRHPFDVTGSLQRLFSQVLGEAPDLGPLPPALRPVIGRALHKDPAERHPDAWTLLRDLAAAVDRRLSGESDAVRDSHLAGARFTGREAELEKFFALLARARGGHGGAVLLGGESGVGKSRLLDELRCVALVQRTLVLGGQAQGEARSGYELFADIVPSLCLHAQVDDEQAAVLQLIDGRLAMRLGRTLPAPPTLQGEATEAQVLQLRLCEVLSSLLSRLQQPVLMLLEDLHRADQASLELLRYISQGVATQPVLIVATYRTDEAADLPQVLPTLTPMRLARLGRPALDELCVAILGPAGQNVELCSLIEQETAGNAYFVVEALRALAAESGGLDHIGRRGLPTEVLAGGIERMLRGRAAGIPPSLLPMLQAAAVVGRYLDLPLLRDRVPTLDDLLPRATDVGVLEVHEGRYRFVQEKLLSILREPLSRGDLLALHSWAAATMTRLYGMGDSHLAQIAEQHRSAEEWDAAASGFARAGERAFVRGAPHAAVQLLSDAVVLHSQASRPLLEQLHVWRLLAHAQLGLGRLNEADRALRTVWRLADSYPATPRQLRRAMLRELGRQLWHRVRRALGGTLAAKRDSEDFATHAELMHTMPVAEVYVAQGRPGRLLLSALKAANLADVYGEAEQQMLTRSGLAFMLSTTPLKGTALRYLRSAERQRQRLRAPAAEVEYLRRRATLLFQLGRLTEAEAAAREAIAMARAQHNDLAEMRGMSTLQMMLSSVQRISELEQLSAEMVCLADRSGNLQFGAMGRMAQAQCLLWRQEWARAAEVAHKAGEMAARSWAKLPEVAAAAFAAMCSLQQGRFAEAGERAGEALTQIGRVPLSMGALEVALRPIADVALALSATAEPGAALGRALFLRALRLLRRLARRAPVVRACAYRYLGELHLREGRPLRAIFWLRRSEAWARATGRTYEQALSHAALARALGMPTAVGTVLPMLGRRLLAAAARHQARGQALLQALLEHEAGVRAQLPEAAMGPS